jgi:hypothetical protein
VLKGYPILVKEAEDERVGAEGKLGLEEQQVGGFGGWWEWYVASILAEETE